MDTMGLSRRNVLLGLGTLIAGGGAVLGTGAFTTVQAERTVSVETAGDAGAFLAFESENDEYVDDSGDTLEIALDGNGNGNGTDDASGLNQNAVTTFRNLVSVTNQGAGTVDTLTLEFTSTPSSVNPDDTFSFPVDEAGDSGQDMVDNGEDILTGENDIPDELTSGDEVIFGLEVDLLNGGDNNALPDDGDYTLTITAESA